jgi:hypothetical protein
MSPLFTAFTFQSIKREPRAGIEPKDRAARRQVLRIDIDTRAQARGRSGAPRAAASPWKALLSRRVENVKSRPIDVETSVRLGETVTAARASEGTELARIAST